MLLSLRKEETDMSEGGQQAREPEERRLPAWFRITVIFGRGTTGPGGYDLELFAALSPGGANLGYAYLVGGARGPIVGMRRPSDARDFWCLNVARTDVVPGPVDARTNWYIRDIGDGQTTFDEISFISSLGGDCATFPDPTGTWLALTAGDFKVLEF